MATSSVGSRKDIQSFFMKPASSKNAEGEVSEVDNMVTGNISLLPPSLAHQDNDLADVMMGLVFHALRVYHEEYLTVFFVRALFGKMQDDEESRKEQHPKP
ncbi:UNVERIFIED_CONTAM: hypothetical protein K2H54_034749 [Gekko kuhli]